jgi:putative endonuclease
LKYYMYIIYSSISDRYYTGHTADLIKRIDQHNSEYSLSTKTGIPWEF